MAAAPTFRRFIEALRPRVVIECGAHVGEDTAWMAATGAAVHAFEPDPRNRPPSDLPATVRWNEVAVSADDGESEFTPSAVLQDGRPWTESGSLRPPLEHLAQYPWVSFGAPIRVRTIALDGYCAREGVGDVDVLWADVQGAELDMLHGAEATIARTSWMALEVSEFEMYAGQARRGPLTDWLAERGWRLAFEEREGPASMAMFVNERLVPQWREVCRAR